MNTIYFDNELSIKKIEPNNEKDWWMIHELEQDPLVYGKYGYLWYLTSTIEDSKYRYLEREDIYNSPFAIYHSKNPIGFLQTSPLSIGKACSSVDLSYAILKQERKKGYMRSVLTNVSDYILEDFSIDEIDLTIHPDNKASQMVAVASGFTKAFQLNYGDYDESFLVYRKTKEMIKK